MSINDPRKFVAGLWDWACLDGCFAGTNIRPTDVDGIVERRGNLLWLETKAPGAPIPLGQLYSFQHLARTGLVSVLVIWGRPGAPVAIEAFSRLGQRRYDPADIETLRGLVRRWWSRVEARDAHPTRPQDARPAAFAELPDEEAPTKPTAPAMAPIMYHPDPDAFWREYYQGRDLTATGVKP